MSIARDDAVAVTLAPSSVRGRIMTALFAAQVCGSTGHAMSLAVGGLMAASITGTNKWTGLPVGIAALGGAIASWPLARLMGRVGRRPGLVLGYSLAVVGAMLAMAGVVLQHFALLLVGMALFGISNTSNLLARYAAADVTPAAQRGRAMGLIVWGSTGGSIIGPNLLTPAVVVGAFLGLSAVPSAFLVSVLGFGLAAVITEAVLRPDPLTIARTLHEPATQIARDARRRSLGEILREPRVRVAFTALMTGQAVMIGTTSTLAVFLHDQGHTVQIVGIGVSLHLAGMYVASPLSGYLADRLGRTNTIVLGFLVLIAGMALAGLPPGSQHAIVIPGLFLNGVGWNLAFVAGSALLTDALSPAERTSMQGLADLVMGMMGALGSATGGWILGTWGFFPLNAVGTALVLIPLAMTWLRPPTLTSAAR
jgi:MFS family permease